MMRIRSIKPEFFRHRALFLAEKRTGFPLRVAFAGLWGCADREGRFKWDADSIKLDILPWDDVDFSAVLAELAAGSFIIRYQSGGKAFGYIPGFLEHQRIPKDEAKSVIPEPPSIMDPPEPMGNPHGSIVDPPGTHHGSPENIAVEGKGREGKGKEREGKSLPIQMELHDPPEKPPEQIQQVWDHYRVVWGSQRKTAGEKNRGIINARLEHFTVAQLKVALDQSKLDDWPDRRKYSKVENLIGSDDKVDSWLRISKGSPAPEVEKPEKIETMEEQMRRFKAEEEAEWEIRKAAIESGKGDPYAGR